MELILPFLPLQIFQPQGLRIHTDPLHEQRRLLSRVRLLNSSTVSPARSSGLRELHTAASVIIVSASYPFLNK